MGKLLSEREASLQRKLIPLNIVVCILALVAAITLFCTPLFKADVGEILRSEAVFELTDDMINDIVGDEVEDAGDGVKIDYKPVVQTIIKQIFNSAEGSISVSGISALHVLTGSGEDKSKILMDELVFGEDAIASKLIDSVVDGVAELFTTEEGKAAVEETLVSTMATAFVEEAQKEVEDEALKNALTEQNVKTLVGIIGELGDETKVTDGKVDGVTNHFISELEKMVGNDFVVDADAKEEITKEVQKIYDETKAELKAGEKVTTESILCVTLSKNVDLSEFNIKDLLGDLLGEEKKTSDVLKSGVADGTETSTSGGNVVTNYNDLLKEVGYDEETKTQLKKDMHDALESKLKEVIEENDVDEYAGYYGYVTFAVLVFMLPWIVLFLFSFFHIIAKNKRFTMWYVKLFGWIPAIFWLALKLVPALLPKFMDEKTMEESGKLIEGVFGGVTSYTWITGLCYILLWLVSIFWAFPIKHKIRKERKAVKNGEASGY